MLSFKMNMQSLTKFSVDAPSHDLDQLSVNNSFYYLLDLFSLILPQLIAP